MKNKNQFVRNCTVKELADFREWHKKEYGSEPCLEALLNMPDIMRDLFNKMLSDKDKIK